MDIDWTILGFAGTIFFGILTAILGAKAIRKPKIEHFEINSYEIGEGLMKEFPDLNISYGGTLIKNNFTVLKGGFISSGKDITGDNIWVEMALPKGCKIIAMNIKTSDEYLTVSSTIINRNRVHYDIGTQFLHNDIIIYSLIVESTEKTDDLFDCLSFKHRLKDSPKIKNYGFVYIMSKQEYRVWLIGWVILNIIIFFELYTVKPHFNLIYLLIIVPAQVPLIMFCVKFAQFKVFKRIEKVARKSNHNETI